VTLDSERDPREAIRLIIDDNSTESDYANSVNGKPNTIEVVEEKPFNVKTSHGTDAVYLWSPADTPLEQQGARYDRYTELPVIQAEAWTKTSATQAHNLVRDMRSILLGYATDNKSSTAWNEIAPRTIDDRRHESAAGTRADHFIEAIQVELFASRQP
jgi:hypothetical protein